MITAITTGVLITLGTASLLAQSQSAPYKPAFTIFALSQKSQYQIGSKPIVKVLIRSTTEAYELADREVIPGCARTSVNITDTKGNEPEKTEYYRHILGEFRPGDGPGLRSDCQAGELLHSGQTLTRFYDLSAYYTLATPGNYNVVITIDDEVRDRPSYSTGHPVSSNAAQFELVASKPTTE